MNELNGMQLKFILRTLRIYSFGNGNLEEQVDNDGVNVTSSLAIEQTNKWMDLNIVSSVSVYS